MASVNARTLGERIRAARKRADLSQDVLGRSVGLDRTAVNRLETGARKVTALELADIAEALGVRMSSFFRDPPPAVVAHRSSQGLDTADSRIDARLAELAEEVRFVASLGAMDLDTGVAARVSDAKFDAPRTHAQAEEMALKARVLMDAPHDQPLHDLADYVGVVGLLAFSEDIGKDTADAGTVLLEEGGVCLVNSHMLVGRRRLALAHELGHYLLGHEYTIDWRIAGNLDQTVPFEARLDRFARALLLPADAIGREWKHLEQKFGIRGAAITLASKFRVDMASLSTRLKELSIADKDSTGYIRNIRTTKTDLIDLNLFVPVAELEGVTVPRTFARAVLRLVRSQRISRERALDLLLDTLTDSDLPAINERHPDEIWKFVS